MPKPMLPLLDRPLLAHTLDHLRRGGVDRAVLACGYLPDAIQEHFDGAYEGIELDYRVEPQPLGTGGAIRFAADGIDRTFLALNGDSLREADIELLLYFHRDRGAKATILLTRVADPARYGLVRTDRLGRVVAFVEKPAPHEVDTEEINAGLYVLEPEVLDLIPPGRQVSIEREIFPLLAERGELYAVALPGYWLDVGTPASYLQAHFDLLYRRGIGTVVDRSADVSPDALLVPPVVVGADVRVEGAGRIGPCVHIGAGATVGARTMLRFAAVLPQAVVGAGTRLMRVIIAPEIGTVTP
jgi:NDP-sugar pyrophosphorylase family protein